jgi:hypothetical protein
MPCFNTYGQPEAGGFDYEIPLQFPFRPQPIDMTPDRATTEPGRDPNNLTNQLATILRESFDIEHKDRGCAYQKPYPNYYDQLPTLEAIESLSFLSLMGRMIKPH